MSAELDRAVKRILALPIPGPSLVDQLGDAHAEIKRLRGLLREIASFSKGKAGGTHAQIFRLANCAERDLTKMEASNG